MNKPYLHYYQNLSLLTYHPSSKTSIKPTLLEARCGYHQLVDRYSKTSINIAIIFISVIYKELYEYWSSCLACKSAYSKLYLKPYKSVIKSLACVSAHSSANTFPIWWLSEKNSWSTEGPWVKQQEDGWLNAVRKLIFRTSTSASFYQSFIGDWSLSIVRNLEEKSRLV